MLNKLSMGNKKVMLLLIMVLVVYLAYLFSFEKAIGAFVVNRQLKGNDAVLQEPGGAFSQLERKHAFYQSVLKGYKVAHADRENRLWQSVSALAIAKNVEISFNPDLIHAQADTSEIAKGVFNQKFNFKGSYFNVIKLLDTLDKSKGIGRISAAKLLRLKENDADADAGPLSMELEMVGKEY